jgi:hypothetical protein
LIINLIQTLVTDVTYFYNYFTKVINKYIYRRIEKMGKMRYIGYINKKAMEKTTIFRVYNSNKIMAYKVATSTRSDEEILSAIIPMFEGTKTIYRVYKNDELVMMINTKKRQYFKKQILEVNTGTIFKDITEMKDVLLLDRKKALELVKKSFNYRYV